MQEVVTFLEVACCETPKPIIKIRGLSCILKIKNYNRLLVCVKNRNNPHKT